MKNWPFIFSCRELKIEKFRFLVFVIDKSKKNYVYAVMYE